MTPSGIIGIIILAIFVIYITYIINEAYKEDCEAFAKSRNSTVVSMDTHITCFGTPFFYVNKGTMIYEIKLSNGETWFMRPSLFGNDWEQNDK